jgi:putative polyketide hydroxylase
VIVGDAAHVATPYGGLGMNLGLADAHNLAWKLALCVTGAAGEDLVGSYEQERHPIGAATVAESARRLAAARVDHVTGATRRGEVTPRPSDGLVLGGTYRSVAVHAEGQPPPESVASYRPDAAPGRRAPHVLLPDGRSTLDLFGPWFTLLTGPRYRDSEPLPDPLHRHRLNDLVTEVYGIGARGAVLVRPDGHVAWRRRCS